MKIEVKKTHFIIIIATMLILAGSFLVMSYGGNTPSEVGHSAGELEGVCKSDGTGCPLNVNVYTSNPSCDAGLSLSATCSSKACSIYDSITGQTVVRYYSCGTAQYTGSCTRWISTPETCPNTLFGQMFVNKTA